MKLYHGTSARFFQKIKKEGLKIRGKRPTHYQNNPSHEEAIYLTNAYAAYYAIQATKKREDLLILEVETDKLNPFAFGPDEDFLEQSQRGKDSIEGDMWERTEFYRKHLQNFMGELESQTISLSLKYLGNCAYFGNISNEAITRYARIKTNTTTTQRLLWQASDPSISLMNYKLCGHKYRNMIKWIFGDPLENHDDNPLMKSMDFCVPETREGTILKSF